MKPVISTMYEMQSQFDQLEEGRLNKNLLYECTNLPGNLFIVMTSHMGVWLHLQLKQSPNYVSLLKIWSQKFEQFCKYDQKYNT